MKLHRHFAKFRFRFIFFGGKLLTFVSDRNLFWLPPKTMKTTMTICYSILAQRMCIASFILYYFITKSFERATGFNGKHKFRWICVCVRPLCAVSVQRSSFIFHNNGTKMENSMQNFWFSILSLSRSPVRPLVRSQLNWMELKVFKFSKTSWRAHNVEMAICIRHMHKTWGRVNTAFTLYEYLFMYTIRPFLSKHQHMAIEHPPN